MALSLKSGSAFTGLIGGKLGLDQFGVDPDEAGSVSSPDLASFVIGKYLSPRLYVSYGLGIFDPVSTIRMKYALSKRLEVVTETSAAASGADLNYTIETGK